MRPPSHSAESPAPALPSTALLVPVAVDVVALTIIAARLNVLLVDRALPPFEGEAALPGGFLLAGEQTMDAARRELVEETGIDPPGHLEQIATYGPQGRDPRGPVLSVAHLLMAPRFAAPRAGGDAGGVRWCEVGGVAARLAFDHGRILADGVERARSKIEYTPLATAFCPPEFTISQLRAVYEAIWGVRLDPRNFHRKATRTEGFLEPTGRMSQAGAGRPAALYRAAPGVDPTATVLSPPLTRPAAP